MHHLTRLALPAAFSLLLLTGCGPGGDADHDGHEHGAHEHDSGHADHDHGSEATDETALRPTDPSADYPLDVCVVSGDELTAMGGPIAYEYEGREVQFCCAGCTKKFLADPSPHLERIDAAR